MASTSDPALNPAVARAIDVEKVHSDDSSPEHGAPDTLSTMEEVPLSTGNDGANFKRQVTGVRWLLVCIGIFSGNILYGLDATIAADIQAAVSGTYDNITQLGWLGVGFNLGSTVTVLPLGKAYARFDQMGVRQLSYYVCCRKCSVWRGSVDECNDRRQSMGWCWRCRSLPWVSLLALATSTPES